MSYTVSLSIPGQARAEHRTVSGRTREEANLAANAALRAFASRKGVSPRAVDVEVKRAA